MRIMEKKKILLYVLLLTVGLYVLTAAYELLQIFNLGADEFFYQELICFAVSAVSFLMLLLALVRKQSLFLFPAAVLLAVSAIFFEGYVNMLCCGILCLMAYRQMADEEADWIPAAAMVQYLVMYCFLAIQYIDPITDENDGEWTAIPPTAADIVSNLILIVLFAAALVIIGYGIQKKRAVWIKSAAAVSLAGQTVAILMGSIMWIDDGMGAMFVGISFVYDFFIQMIGSPIVLLSLYLLVRKSGEEAIKERLAL